MGSRPSSGLHEERFEPTHGPLRRAARAAVGRFLDYGLLEHGYVRVRCSTCRAEFLVALRCQGRHFCPSCHARRLAEWSLWLDERLPARVAHRQVVQTLPRKCVTEALRGGVRDVTPHPPVWCSLQYF
jgi:hypothetical protein